MMKEIEEVLHKLSKEELSPTPENYTKAYYSLLSAGNISLKEFDYLKRFIQSLDKSEQELLPEDLVTYYDLCEVLSHRLKKSELSLFTKQLSFLMRPSVDMSLCMELDKLILELSDNPSNIVDKQFVKKLLTISDKRVINDRVALKDKSKDIQNLTQLIRSYFDKAIEENSSVDNEIEKINEQVKQSDDNDIVQLKSEFSKLLTTFHETLNKNQEELKRGQTECQKLQEKVDVLEKNLLEIQKEKDVDYLTGLLNRRGFIHELQKIEHQYEALGNEYAMVFFDLDHFKEINDDYGHECGDFVLSTFSKLLKELTRTGDVVSRYGGEEFIALVHYKKKGDIEKYIKRIKLVVNNHWFVYQDLKIKITFSAGVTMRKNYSCYNETLAKADEILYRAKNSGRNRILLDDGTIL